MLPSRPIHIDEVRAQVAQGVVEGLQLILADEKIMGTFWHRGYEELVSHGKDGTSMWFGKRIMFWVLVSLIGATIWFLVRSK